MTWEALDVWIVVAGALAAVACALPGTFLVLRRMSMMGDAISHAVLPGLAAAFLLTQSRSGLVMLLGAAIVGVLTAVFTEWVHRFGRVEQSASMGVVFTVLFAIGLLMIVQAADHVDLDPGCVLYGALEFTPLDTMLVLGHAVPRVVVRLAILVLANILFVVLLFKELRISSFDPALSTTVGISAAWLHHALMVVVAVTTVLCFESVGSILVIAMLVVPAATAHLLTDRLWVVLVLAAGLGVVSAVGGHAAALEAPGWIGFEGRSTSTAGMMAAVSGCVFLAAFLFAPEQGVLGRAWRRCRMEFDILAEDVLGLFHRLDEAGAGDTKVVPRLLRDTLDVGPWACAVVLALLWRRGLLCREAGVFHVTARGRAHARSLVRSHRLWESYLHRHLRLAADHVHPSAERLEHVTSAELQRRLAARMQNPELDPHGHPIPDTADHEE